MNEKELRDSLSRIDSSLHEIKTALKRSLSTRARKKPLHEEKDTTKIGEVNTGILKLVPKNNMENTAEIIIDFAKHHTVVVPLDDDVVYLHGCRICVKRFKSYSGDPQKCPHCGSRNWKTGMTKWDERRAREAGRAR